MYEGRVGDTLGIIGETLKYEVDLLCQLKYEKQKGEIEKSLQELDDAQIGNLQKLIGDLQTLRETKK
jgi:hypothetical protein